MFVTEITRDSIDPIIDNLLILEVLLELFEVGMRAPTKYEYDEVGSTEVLEYVLELLEHIEYVPIIGVDLYLIEETLHLHQILRDVEVLELESKE